MIHVLSPLYNAEFDQIGQNIQEIAVCSGMLQNEWKNDLLKNITDSGTEVLWHDVSLSNYKNLEPTLKKGDIVWILIDGIETDGYPGPTVIGYIESLQNKFDLRIIGPGLKFYSQNKIDQKKFLMEKRINTPAYFLPENAEAAADCFSFLFNEKRTPYIIKPFDLYCSIGIEIDSAVDNKEDARRVYDRLRAKTPNIIIEQFIQGREFTVVCIGNERQIKVYPPAERVYNAARPGMGFMDFSMTQILHGDHSIMEMTGVSDPDLIREIENISQAAFRAVGADAYVRIDIRMDSKTGLLYILEVNPCPSVGIESSIEEILLLNGISFKTFFEDLITNAAASVKSETQPVDHNFFGNDTVTLSSDPVKGRCILTRRDIKKGEDLFTVDIEAFGAEEIYKQNYCHHCLQYSEQPYTIRCGECGQVYYCSDRCREFDSLHANECAALARFYEDPADPMESITYYRTDIQALSRLLGETENPLAILVSNYDKTDTAKRIETWKIAFKLEELFDRKLSLSNILATVCSTDCNCFSADYDPDGVTLLSSKFAMLEHNCIPNAARKIDGRKVTVFSLKDIPANSPVSISYISALYHRNVRLQNLAEYYYFQCKCPLCQSENDEISGEDFKLLKEYYRPDTPVRLSSSSCYSFLSGRTIEHRADSDVKYPSVLKDTLYGKGLFASENLQGNCPVEKFDGDIMPYRMVPESEKSYALLLKNDEWLVSFTNARYINHSCKPNCKIDENRVVHTIRPVSQGEELTISYNRVGRREYNESPESFFWDQKWTFTCRCGCENCAGLIDKYEIID